MKKYIICSIIAFLILIVGISIMALTKKDDFDDTAYIKLSTNGGVPYNWEYEIDDNSIVKFDEKKSSDKSGKNIEGGPVELTYYFKGVKEGNAVITFNYKNITDGSIAETKVYNVIVDKKLKINIEEMN